MSIFRAEGRGLGQAWAEHSSMLDLADDYHGIQNLFGLSPSERVSAYVVDYGISTAHKLLMRDIAASGSFMSSEIGEAPEHMGRESVFLRQLQPIFRRKVDWRKNPNVDKKKVLTRIGQTLNVVFNEGALRLDRLSSAGYGYLKIFQGMMGSNLDIHGYDKLGNSSESTKTLMALLSVGYRYLVKNDEPRIMSLTSTFGRLQNIHITSEGDTYSGGINVMCLPHDWVERFTKMINIRVHQTGKVDWPQKGMEAHGDTDKIGENIVMVGQPESQGEWLMHTARAIRVAVMHGFGTEKMDIDSFVDKKPVGSEMNFEAVVGIVDNLVVAHAHNPELTKEMINKFGLENYFDKASVEEVRVGLAKADKELFGVRSLPIQYSYFFQRPETYFYRRLQDLSELVAKFMPVSASEFERLTPPSERREKIEGKMIGNDATITIYNPGLIKEYMVDGKLIKCRSVEMDGVIALDKMIEEGRRQGIPEHEIQYMITDRETLWRLAPYTGGIV